MVGAGLMAGQSINEGDGLPSAGLLSKSGILKSMSQVVKRKLQGTNRPKIPPKSWDRKASCLKQVIKCDVNSSSVLPVGLEPPHYTSLFFV